MLSLNRAIVALIIFTGLVTAPVTSADRIKDITDVAGVRANKLVGFGLVVGLLVTYALSGLFMALRRSRISRG